MTEPIAAPQPNHRIVKTHLAAIFLLWAVLYGSFTLFTPPLLDDADSVHAEVAREILTRHDWVTLYANGIRYLEKAPLMYWSIAACFRIFGVQDWVARLPTALWMLALLLILYDFGRRAFFSARAGLYATLLFGATFGPFIFSRILIPDIALCLWTTLAIYFFWLAMQSTAPSRLLCWGFAAACALNVLTKGLIGIIFPIGTVLFYLIITRSLSRLRRMHLLSSALIFLAIAAPWHILAAINNPTIGHPAPAHWVADPTIPLLQYRVVVEPPTQSNVHGWAWFYFLNEHLFRYFNVRVPRDYDTVPGWLFWGLLLIWLIPWSMFLLPAIFTLLLQDPAWPGYAWKDVLRRSRNDAGRYGIDDTKLYLIGWAAVVMVFFSFSTRQEYYVLPSLPALALLIAAWLHTESISDAHSPIRITGRRIAFVMLVLGTLAALAAIFLAIAAKTPLPSTDISTLLTQNPGKYALSFGHFLDLNARVMGFFRLPLIITAITVFFGTFANWLLRRRNRLHAANLSLAVMSIAFLIAAHISLVIFSPVLTSKSLADAIVRQIHPDDLVIIHGEYEAGSTLGFYLARRVDILPISPTEGRSANLWYGSFFPDAPAIFEDDATFAAKWHSPQRIFLWTTPNTVSPLASPAYVIAQSGGKEILSNQPVAVR
jgi:4-amino-4-deoxy-L-arabinose transferase-like glycosyltransferase